MSDKQKLKDWINRIKWSQKYLKTSEVYKWGAENFSNRAVRNAQDLALKGELLERITKEEAILAGFTGNEGVWKIK